MTTRNSIKTTIFIIFTVVWAMGVALAQAGWAKYVNARYGYSIEYPATFRTSATPANADGKVLSDAHGASLTLYGTNNVMNETLASAFQAIVKEKGPAVTYKASGKTWFVVSWRNDNKIYYQKQFVGGGSMNAFIFAYPAHRDYDAVVTRLERSFRPGVLSESH